MEEPFIFTTVMIIPDSSMKS